MNAGTSDPVTKRLFRRLLTLYPRRFLGEHEQDMLLLFEELEDKSKKQKGTFHLRFLLRAYLDVVSSAARAHRLESCQSKKTKTLAKQRKKRSSIMSTWSHDAKVATRLITKQPGFTLVAAITLRSGSVPTRRSSVSSTVFCYDLWVSKTRARSRSSACIGTTTKETLQGSSKRTSKTCAHE